ncbi:uncharacterized protein CYBJADRAFT_59631 [Cyberlindnera jadinii NRRL Y-1542]|uniref:Uncharacterized protein n=1 Tax=Cyberlindnera jadinii (strain ATCC 18201 / CBS 1600 / BCRC 20928 / JCM 3617 / NBRC 0987 / NRRL Y-1542) TaxID=983966 RepID=A0A1E4S5F8_CYBJN|nr:hypothetical protein CYBJADRAFT_59631 [Cyberlindnera jadinii NRRL Y-1542]ODV74632.1 hypothetical protein CYBJADRAFT_59631 [Cyberlindnera jadinii NRRL Y-1542]
MVFKRYGGVVLTGVASAPANNIDTGWFSWWCPSPDKSGAGEFVPQPPGPKRNCSSSTSHTSSIVHRRYYHSR